MLAEFAHTPCELVIDLDSYEGPWSHIQSFRGRSGWLRVVRATIQSEHNLLNAELVAACDESGNPWPSWRAVSLTKCCWSKLSAASVEPPEILDDLICEEEGALFARWHREMNAAVAEAGLRAAMAIEQLEAWHDFQARNIAIKLRELRRERLFQLSPDRRIELALKIRALEEEEDELVELTAGRRRLMRSIAEAEEEALWDSSDLLIEVEPCFTVYWHGEARLLHNRNTLFDGKRRPRGRPRKIRPQHKYDSWLEANDNSAPIVQPIAVTGAPQHEQPAPAPFAPEQAAPVEPQPERPAPDQLEVIALPTERHSQDAARLIALLAPLRDWPSDADFPPPDWLTVAVLKSCNQALFAEDQRLAERQLAEDVTPRRSAQLFDLREELAALIDAVARALRWHGRNTPPAVEAAEQEPEPEAETEPEADPETEVLVKAEPQGPPPLPIEEWQWLMEQREALIAKIERLERMVGSLKSFAPRRAGYLAQIRAAQKALVPIDAELERGLAEPRSCQDETPGEASANWTAEEVAVLRRMWSDGYTAREIAAVLGRKARNAVIGKAKRLGLSFGAQSSALPRHSGEDELSGQP